eukprot:3563924-Amphidinium_carterae.1
MALEWSSGMARRGCQRMAHASKTGLASSRWASSPSTNSSSSNETAVAGAKYEKGVFRAC